MPECKTIPDYCTCFDSLVFNCASFNHPACRVTVLKHCHCCVSSNLLGVSMTFLWPGRPINSVLFQAILVLSYVHKISLFMLLKKKFQDFCYFIFRLNIWNELFFLILWNKTKLNTKKIKSFLKKNKKKLHKIRTGYKATKAELNVFAYEVELCFPSTNDLNILCILERTQFDNDKFCWMHIV